MRSSSFVLVVCSLLASSFIAPVLSHADTFTASYRAAGAQTPGSTTGNVNTFELLAFNAVTGSTTFNNSGITGTYSGNYSLLAANQFGGAGGSGTYISTADTYSLSLSSSVNYFGLWLSALDAGNQLSFYNGNTLLYTFSASTFQGALGACTGSNAYCGNPNTAYKGQDSGEQFAFLNFYDNNGSFNKVTFTEAPGFGAFESDNHAVANLSSAPLGTNIVTPEPSSWILALTGIGAIATMMGLRRSAIV